MTNKDIRRIAMEQSAIDLNCSPTDFLLNHHKIVISESNPLARKYLTLPFYCNIVSYGGNIVASINKEAKTFVDEYLSSYPAAHCFETPNMHILNEALEKRGMRICFMAEYFLPDIPSFKEIPCDYELKILYPEDFKGLYTEAWRNALCEKRRHLDVLGVGAYCGGRLIGLAGCSADCERMWQIGIDVLPEYRNHGIAASLTSRLALEILKRGKVPFYCAAWSNIASVRNAIKSGFRPAWVEMTAKDIDFVAEMNKVTINN